MAAQKSANKFSRIDHLVKAAKEFHVAENATGLRKAVDQVRSESADSAEAEIDILWGLKQIAETTGDVEFELALGERIIELEPNNHDLRVDWRINIPDSLMF